MNENYIDTLIDILKSPLSMSDFEAVMERAIPVLYTQWNEEGFGSISSDHYLEFLALVREKIVGFIKQGKLIDNNYINLYFLFREANLQCDQETQNLIHLLEKTYLEYREDQKEKFIFAHLIFVLSFLNGDGKRGLLVFLSEHLYFDGVSYDSMNKNGEMLKSFLISQRIVFEEVSEILAYGLEKENFISRSLHQRHSAMVWMLRFFWHIDGFMNHNGWKTMIYPKLLDLFHFYLSDNNAIETVMHLHFLMSHLYMNSAQTQKEFHQFNDEVEIRGSEYYRQWGECAGLEKPKFANHKEKTKIALIKDRIVRNSPSNVELSLLRQLLNNEEFTKAYTITIYTLSIVEKSLDDQTLIKELRELGIVVKESATETLDYSSTYQSHLFRALAVREDMQREGTDIMIAATNNFPEVSFLFSTRSSSKQIFWSHGNFEYDVQNIDRRITHCTVPEECFTFSHFSVQRDYSQYKAQQVISEAETIRSQYGKDTVILGSIGRLVKVDSLEYLESVAKLLQKNSNAVYLACGSGSTESIKRKVEALGIEDRFIFVGFVEAKIYANVLDIYLDTFPHHGGESVREAQMAGCCVVTLHIESEKGPPDLRSVENDILLKQVNYQLEKLDEEWLSNEGFIHQVISFASLNTDAYIGIVDYFIKHPNCRQMVKNVFKTYTPEMVSYKEFLEVIGFE